MAPANEESHATTSVEWRQRASTAVARIRSVASGRVVYASRGKPWNSESVVLSSTRSFRPETTWVPCSVTVTTAVRTQAPERREECGPSRCQPIDSSVTLAPETCGCVLTKCRASSSPNASGAPTPCSRANAYTVFFIVSVGSTPALSPLRWVAARSPESATLTFRSIRSWRSPPRRTCTRRVSALPYRLRPNTIATGSAPSVGGVAVAAQQQRHVVVPVRVVHVERDGDLGEEGLTTEVRLHVEHQPVAAGLPVVQRDPVPQPAVVVGAALGDQL